MIVNLNLNQSVSFNALIKKIRQGVASNGAPYLTITLQDKTGSIDARLWNAQPEDIAALKPGLVIAIKGYLTLYRNTKQLKIDHYELLNQAEVDFKAFYDLPVDQAQMWTELNDRVSKIKDYDLKRLITAILTTYHEPFLNWPAAVSVHHALPGGLLWHTTTMLKSAAAISAIYADRNIDTDLLASGIILHDLGKIKELSQSLGAEFTVAGRLIGHISLGVNILVLFAAKLKIPTIKVTLLEHLILSSHGEYEFGSPVRPAIIEAEILHFVDNLDAHLYVLYQNLKDLEPGAWTERLFPLEGRNFMQHLNYTVNPDQAPSSTSKPDPLKK